MVRYLTEDHLGTPRVVTDSQGAVISRRDFLPFGEQLDPDVGGRSSVAAYQPANDNVKQKFTGYQKDDESGLDFAEARMYENRHGRFTAVDPLLASGKSANPQTFNRFVYCLNSPLILIDPDGESHIIVSVDSDHKATITFYFLRNGKLESKTFYGLASGQGLSRANTNGPIPFGVYKSSGQIEGGSENWRYAGKVGYLRSWGRGRIGLKSTSVGEIAEYGLNRSEFFFHGGGGKTDGEAFKDNQTLLPTNGCIRMYNVDIVELISLVRAANKSGDTLDNIFVGADILLTAWANKNDSTGKPLFPELEKWRGRVVGGARATVGLADTSERPRQEDPAIEATTDNGGTSHEDYANDPEPVDDRAKRRH